MVCIILAANLEISILHISNLEISILQISNLEISIRQISNLELAELLGGFIEEIRKSNLHASLITYMTAFSEFSKAAYFIVETL